VDGILTSRFCLKIINILNPRSEIQSLKLKTRALINFNVFVNNIYLIKKEISFLSDIIIIIIANSFRELLNFAYTTDEQKINRD